MNPELHSAIRRRLDRDFNFKEHGKWLQDGECPECGKKTLYAPADGPWVIRCNRLNHCGYERHVKELYDDLFNTWSERHPKTPANPNAAADAYLRDARGLDLAKIAGWYTQESYWDSTLKIGSATVRFPLPGIGYFERIIDQPHRFGHRKATIHGSYKGRWWVPPGLELHSAERIFITEGIFDAIALAQAGYAAVSALSSNHYPDQALQALAAQSGGNGRPELVWALDSDKAGKKYTQEWVKRSRAEGWPTLAAQIPTQDGKKLDWNDLLQRGKLTAEHMEEYLYHGALLIAASAEAKAKIIYLAKGWRSFHVDYDSRLYWFEVDFEKMAKALKDQLKEKSDEERREEELKFSDTTEICDCLPQVLYYMASEITDDYWYYVRVEFDHGGPPVKSAFTATQLRENTEFRKRLFAIAAGGIWTGKPHQLERWLKQQTHGVRVVKTIDYVGYAKEFGAWIFADVAIQGGKVYRANAEDYFELGRVSVKSLSKSVELDLNTDLAEFSTDWLSLFWTCFGAHGLAVLSFYFLSLFAEQISAKLKFFPFLEVIGEPGSGKSTCVEFLWKLLGRIWEGFDPTTSNAAAVARYFNQVSGLPVALIEGDRTVDQATGRPQKSFEWDSTKKLYNRRGFKARGVKNSGNDVYDPPFRGTLAVVQNHPIQADKATLERFIQIPFDKKGHTDTTRNAVRKLETLGMSALSGFLVKACCAEKEVLETFFATLPEMERLLAKEPLLKTYRIITHYALLIAGVRTLQRVLPITDEQFGETLSVLFSLAVKRQRDISSDHPILEAFWALFHDIEDAAPEGQPALNHSLNPKLIAINLTDYAQYVGKQGLQYQAPNIADLRRLFPGSTTHKFIGNKVVDSAVRKAHNAKCMNSQRMSESVRCWVFER